LKTVIGYAERNSREFTARTAERSCQAGLRAHVDKMQRNREPGKKRAQGNTWPLFSQSHLPGQAWTFRFTARDSRKVPDG